MEQPSSDLRRLQVYAINNFWFIVTADKIIAAQKERQVSRREEKDVEQMEAEQN